MDWTWVDVLWHVLAYPIYQILGTIRHEGCHAIVAKHYGATIEEFRFLPCRRDGVWYWGYVRWSGALTEGQARAVRRAPYPVDVLLVAAWAYLYACQMALFGGSFHPFAIVTILLLVSPVIDIVYNTLKAAVWGRGDLVG